MPAKPLNPRQKQFARGLFEGISASKSYANAYAKGATNNYTERAAAKLRTDPRIQAYMDALDEKLDSASLLTVQEKREKLATIVRADLHQVDETHPAAKKVTRSESESGSSETIEAYDKLKAIELDSKLAGHLTPEKHQHEINPTEDLANLIAGIRTENAPATA
jgi:hypothetical protein